MDTTAPRARIEALSVFGRPPGGTFADGVSRVAYSDADVEGRRYVMQLMTAAGFDPTHRSGRQHLRSPGAAICPSRRSCSDRTSIRCRAGATSMAIFVPSVGGISHSPKELTSWADCANGANVLLQAILAIDRER